MTVTFPA